MALASPSLRISVTPLRRSNGPFSLTHLATLTNSFRPIQHPSRTTLLTFSSRRRRDSGTTPITSKSNTTNKKKLPAKKVEKLPAKTVEETDDIDEDAFEALFRLLDEDLKNDELNGNNDEDYEISEEELAKLERELAEAFEDDELVAAFGSLAGGDVGSEDEDEDEDEDDDEEEEGDVIKNGEDELDIDDDEEGDEEEQEEEETPIKLKNWQLRRLGYALKKGRRKTSIKSLAAELCVDRSIVLKLLRDPPPKLLMLSAALPDKPVSAILEPVENSIEPAPLETEVITHDVNPEEETKVPVHVMQSNWSARKRMKKVQVETLEQVYKKTKRPTNAMVSSIVHVTNLPRKKVVKWFEDKRSEEGVPDNRSPYQRSDAASESVFTS